jgi:hypothetical protein
MSSTKAIAAYIFVIFAAGVVFFQISLVFGVRLRSYSGLGVTVTRSFGRVPKQGKLFLVLQTFLNLFSIAVILTKSIVVVPSSQIINEIVFEVERKILSGGIRTDTMALN